MTIDNLAAVDLQFQPNFTNPAQPHWPRCYDRSSKGAK